MSFNVRFCSCVSPYAIEPKATDTQEMELVSFQTHRYESEHQELRPSIISLTISVVPIGEALQWRY